MSLYPYLCSVYVYILSCLQKLKPTATHMAIVALLKSGYLRFVCSQNIENLHKLSGIPEDLLWEAHGNVCVAHCPNCGRVFPSPPDSKMCDGCWDPSSSAARRTWRTGMLKRSVISHYGAKVML
jgi:NAD-dependent SIR2 family protein deacetylase